MNSKHPHWDFALDIAAREVQNGASVEEGKELFAVMTGFWPDTTKPYRGPRRDPAKKPWWKFW